MEQVKPPNLKLKKLMLERDIKQRELADVLGITQSLFSQKLNEARTKFTLPEVIALCSYLDINMHEYFFDPNVLKSGQKRRRFKWRISCKF